MTCKGVLCTDKHLGVDTDQVKLMCKSIIKLCNEEPHAIDSLLERAYIELSMVGLLMKRGADRAKEEREQHAKQQKNRKQERRRIPDLVQKVTAGLTTKRIEQMLADMSPESLQKFHERLEIRRA